MIYKFERKLKGANQVEATGEELTINNAGRKVQKFELSGRSEQETREGYNLLNVPSNFEITSSQNNRIVPISLKANTTYTIQADEIDTDNISTSPNFLFRLRYNNEDVDNIRVLLRAKKISFTTMGNVDTVWIYSGTSYNESATTNTTFKNLMIYEGTAEKSYEPYTGGVPSPNPDYPQEIQNVGDNINLYDKNNPNILNTPIDSNGTGVNVQNTYKTIWIPCKPNTTYTVSKIFDTTRNRFAVGYSSIEPNYSQAVEGYMSNEKRNVLTVTTNTTAKYLLAYVWITGGSTTYEEMLDSIKIEEGTKATSYSNYNCGNLEVTISNKNLYKVEKVINDSNAPNFIFLREGNVEFTTGAIPLIIAPTTIKEKTEYTYILKCKSNVTTENNINFKGIYEDGTSELLSANKKEDTNEFIVKFKTNKEKTLAYVTQQYTNSAGTTIITEGTMILEGDYLNLDEPYEIHQEQEIIFPLEEGQKLYEGSYLAEDGIHQVTKMINIDIDNYTATMASEGLLSLSNATGHRWNYISIKGLCSHFKNANNENITANGPATNNLKDNEFNFRAGATKDRIYFKNSSLKTLDDWKNFFKNNDVMLAYEVEEEIIPYTPEQQEIYSQLQNLELFRGCNHITVESNVKPTIKLSYYDGELDMTDYKYNLQFKKHMQEM